MHSIITLYGFTINCRQQQQQQLGSSSPIRSPTWCPSIYVCMYVGCFLLLSAKKFWVSEKKTHSFIFQCKSWWELDLRINFCQNQILSVYFDLVASVDDGHNDEDNRDHHHNIYDGWGCMSVVGRLKRGIIVSIMYCGWEELIVHEVYDFLTHDDELIVLLLLLQLFFSSLCRFVFFVFGGGVGEKANMKLVLLKKNLGEKCSYELREPPWYPPWVCPGLW